MALNAVPVPIPSCDNLNLDVPKKVHWALDLEEIVYFAPDTECKAHHPKLKKFQTKFYGLKNNRLSGLLDVFDRYRLHRFHSRTERIIETSSTHCDETTAEDLIDSNTYWDELFDLYGECKPVHEKEKLS